MRNIFVIIVLAPVPYAHNKELVANHTTYVQDSMNKSVDKLSDNLLDRALSLKVQSLHHAKLDETTLVKHGSAHHPLRPSKSFLSASPQAFKVSPSPEVRQTDVEQKQGEKNVPLRTQGVNRSGIQRSRRALKNLEHFNSIELMKRVGIFCWDPTGLPQKQFINVTVHDILQGTHRQETQPEQIVPLRNIHTPLRFRSLPQQRVLHMFPNDAGYIVPLYVAKERGVDLQSVDFVIGGSLLNLLATQTIDRGHRTDVKYLLQKCPTTDIILMARSYRGSNYADIGFQFERLVTGQRLDEKHSLHKFFSLQLMKVANYTVLIAAETDAVDPSGKPVEVKAQKPKYFAMQVMFQMLSIGAEKVIMADRRGPRLSKIKVKTFDELVRKHSCSRLAEAEARIATALNTLKRSSEITAESTTELDFDPYGEMSLKQNPNSNLFPSASVVEELLATTTHSGRIPALAPNSRWQATTGSGDSSPTVNRHPHSPLEQQQLGQQQSEIIESVRMDLRGRSTALPATATSSPFTFHSLVPNPSRLPWMALSPLRHPHSPPTLSNRLHLHFP